MRKTFICNESMTITIPIGSLKNIREGQLMPENFHCVFRDNFKVFVVRGKPKPLGVSFTDLCCKLNHRHDLFFKKYQLFFSFLISGLLSFAAGKYPNMHVTKLSFSLNIISFFWSLVAFVKCCFEFEKGIIGLIITLLVFECMMSLFLIYWQSKAVCREHFNTLVCVFSYKLLLNI
uniref:Uncharacterized protein n=1 Tax=Poecilia mexicana TaxID=48701 RepID=A0A3B3Z3L9_9TELE